LTYTKKDVIITLRRRK